jgi:uncharacterized protein with GYD domain
MIRYVSLLKFTEQGARALNKSTARATAFSKTAAKLGVNVEAVYWTVGAYDGILILTADDETQALRCLAGLAAAGNVRTETLRAFDAEEFGALAGK